jgi:hypothetical protein
MLSVFRPSSEVIKEGWILNSGLVVCPPLFFNTIKNFKGNFLSGYRKFEIVFNNHVTRPNYIPINFPILLKNIVILIYQNYIE